VITFQAKSAFQTNPMHFLPRLNSGLTLLLGWRQWNQVYWILILWCTCCISPALLASINWKYSDFRQIHSNVRNILGNNPASNLVFYYCLLWGDVEIGLLMIWTCYVHCVVSYLHDVNMFWYHNVLILLNVTRIVLCVKCDIINQLKLR